MGAGPQAWVWVLGRTVQGWGCGGIGHSVSKVGEEGASRGPGPVDMLFGGDPGQGPHATRALPGIDKLTEKSQVSEDGTLRSLEPASQQGSPEGSPTEEVGHGDCWDWVRLSGPFCPGLPGALASVTCSRGASTQLTLWGGDFRRPLPFALVTGSSPWPSDSPSISLI